MFKNSFFISNNYLEHKMTEFEVESMSGDSEPEDDSDLELQEAFARGDLKPGLNIEISDGPKKAVNNILGIRKKLDNFKLNLPWIERLDICNDLAPLAPEQTIQMQKYEQKRANLFAGNAKIKSFTPDEDPILNDFRREMTFHRQAQATVVEGIKRLHNLNIVTKRPDDYFAEMAKTDVHMQKVRENLSAKQQGQAKSERLKQIRDQRKMGKLIQRQARVQKETEKREMLDKLKKFRKGKLRNLDFLEDNRKTNPVKSAEKRKARDHKFGFGGKKRGQKRNTKDSSMDTGGSKPFSKLHGGNKNKKPTKRLGKSKRVKAKAKSGR